MGARYQHGQQGFTIVETVLFMAITGLLAATLLGGWTVMLNNQRYRDSVNTLQSFIQQQYNLVYNVENGRDNNLSCIYNGPSGYTIGNSGLSNTDRGQSGCVVIGRYIAIEKGVSVKVSSIIGLDPGTTDTSSSDVDSINLYKPQRVDVPVGLSSSELEIPWGASVTSGSADTNPKSYAVAIIRAPLTGTVHTYTEPVPDDGSQPNVGTMVSFGNESSDVALCINAGAPLTNGAQGVIIKAFASSQSSIEKVAGGVCA